MLRGPRRNNAQGTPIYFLFFKPAKQLFPWQRAGEQTQKGALALGAARNMAGIGSRGRVPSHKALRGPTTGGLLPWE